jgi:hypothetical protein
LELRGRTLVVLPEPQRETELSFRNLPHVKVTYSRSLSVYDVVAADHVVFTTSALDVLEGKEPAPTEGRGSSPADAKDQAGTSPAPPEDEEDES